MCPCVVNWGKQKGSAKEPLNKIDRFSVLCSTLNVTVWTISSVAFRLPILLFFELQSFHVRLRMINVNIFQPLSYRIDTGS